MPKNTPAPAAIPDDRFMNWSDAETGVAIALDQAELLDGILHLLHGQADSQPSQPLSEFVLAAILLARESLANLKCGAEQARDNLQALRPASGEVVR